MKHTRTDPSRDFPGDPHESWESASALVDQIERDGREFYSLVFQILNENNELKSKVSKMELGFTEFKKHVVEMNREMAKRIFIDPAHSKAQIKATA